MLKKLLILAGILLGWSLQAQDCSSMITPLDGSTGVSVGTAIDWGESAGITSYKLRLGTTLLGDELGEFPVGNTTFYLPPQGLPENTTIFVTVILDFPFTIEDDIECPLGSFTTESITTLPDCGQMTIPTDGATDVSVFTDIRWDYSTRATSYQVILREGGNVIYDEIVTGSLSFNPPTVLPENTFIEVEIIPVNSVGEGVSCSTPFTFTTGELVALPDCSRMVSPFDGEINVSLSPTLTWEASPRATGYRVTITKTPTPQTPEDTILGGDEFPTNSTPIIDLEPNTTYFIRIVPFNEAGDAIGCVTIESFSTEVGCGPYFDPVVGDFVTLGPEASLNPIVSICENELPFTLDAPDLADGYRWYRLLPNGRTELLSEDFSVDITEAGRYAYEPYNLAGPLLDLECPSYMEFDVFSSEIATIDRIRGEFRNGRLELEAIVSGIGNYTFALDKAGPYRSSPVFSDLDLNTYTIYVQDEQGCGTTSATYLIDNTVNGFPAFFTPDGNFPNDTWQYIPPEGVSRVFPRIRIFDRYGKFLKEFSSLGDGWDGTFIGRPLPASDYWYVAIDTQGNVVKGHFSLKR